MSLIEIFIFFLLEMISSRWFEEQFRASRNYIISHKHVEVGNLQAHNDLPAVCTPWTDTLPLGVKVPGIQLTQKVILLRDPYVPVYKLFLLKVPAEALANKQLFKTVVPRRVFKLENR